MALVATIKGAFKDFKNGLKIIFAKPKEGEGDRKLAKMSLMVKGMIATHGKHAVRTQVIKSIEKDLNHAAKKGGEEAVNKKIDVAFQTPEYVDMLQKLGLEYSHVKVMAMQALRSARK